MIVSKLTSKAQTTIPQAIRLALQLGEGDEIVYVIKENNEVSMSKRRPGVAEDPFGTFDEWDGDADRRAYANL